MRIAGRWRALVLALVLLAVTAASSAGTRGIPTAMAARNPAGTSSTLTLGFFDGAFDGPAATHWLGRAAAAGADVVRIDIGWVAPNGATKPAGFNAQNPADPNYNFTQADIAVRAATDDHMRVILEFTGAPLWAEGRGMPASATPGTWKPSPAAIHDYAIALAKRYSGTFADPANPGSTLPRVWAFQLWNEPNLSNYLAPQWSGGHPEAPDLYRSMLNAFYAGVKSVDGRALVVTAGTAPFGDPEVGGPRLMPALFWRGVLCVRQSGTSLSGGTCTDPAHFDVMAHQPYSVGAPNTNALNADDVSIPDMGKLFAILRTAERAGTALPRVRHPIWVTETSYNTKPPNPNGIPVGEEARWQEQTFELLWRQGVPVITWNTIVDQPPEPSYSTTSQAGIYYLSGRAKPSLQTFQLPLVAKRTAPAAVLVWVRAPRSGRLAIQMRSGGTWRTLSTRSVCAGCTTLTTVHESSPITVRAVLGTLTGAPYAVH